jgi:hypothetical protein
MTENSMTFRFFKKKIRYLEVKIIKNRVGDNLRESSRKEQSSKFLAMHLEASRQS